MVSIWVSMYFVCVFGRIVEIFQLIADELPNRMVKVFGTVKPANYMTRVVPTVSFAGCVRMVLNLICKKRYCSLSPWSIQKNCSSQLYNSFEVAFRSTISLVYWEQSSTWQKWYWKILYLKLLRISQVLRYSFCYLEAVLCRTWMKYCKYSTGLGISGRVWCER